MLNFKYSEIGKMRSHFKLSQEKYVFGTDHNSFFNCKNKAWYGELNLIFSC